MTPKRAMVLAAGLGVRMRPLTQLRPKPVLPVLNKPLVAHTLERLASQGVRLAVVNSHHLPLELESQVRRWVPEGLDLRFSREDSLLGTAGGLRKAAGHFDGERIFLVNSDSMTDADLGAAAEAHERSGRAATLIVVPHDPAAGYRPVRVAGGDGPTGRLAAIAGRSWGAGPATSTMERTFTGVHVIEARVLEAIPDTDPCDINADVYPRLLDADPECVGAWLHGGWWFEAGSPARYLELNLVLLARSGRDAVVGPGFFIDEEARVRQAVLGAGARLMRGSAVEECVLWDDVTVGEWTRLRGCIVTDGVALPSYGSWQDAILMPGEDGAPAVHPLTAAT